MKRNFKNNVLVLCAALGMSACNVESKNANQETQATDWKVSFDYQAPEQEGGIWQRTIVVDGYDNAFLPIDLQQEGSRAWVEIGKTDDQGRFSVSNSEGRIRYRIGGEQLTDWVSEQRDVMVTSFPSPSVHQGIRCIVPAGVTLFIGAGELSLNCDNVLVKGNIFAFPGPAASHLADTRKKRTGGNLLINATSVEVGGQINIQGESGYYSGDGGSVVINYEQMRTAPGRIDAAPGGVNPPVANMWPPNFPWHPVAGLAGSVVLNKKENTED